MNIGMIVHSQTGNTLSVAEMLKERLAGSGHTVTLELLKVSGGYNPGKQQEIEFEALPDAGKYDAIVFGAPVEAFSLSPVMLHFLSKVGRLDGTKAACLLTQAFPYEWMGGKRAAGQMKKACTAKGATVCATGIVNWMNKKRREEKVQRVVDELGKAF